MILTEQLEVSTFVRFILRFLVVLHNADFSD